MIAVIDYGMGNIGSIINMFHKIGAEGILFQNGRFLPRAQSVKQQDDPQDHIPAWRITGSCAEREDPLWEGKQSDVDDQRVRYRVYQSADLFVLGFSIV